MLGCFYPDFRVLFSSETPTLHQWKLTCASARKLTMASFSGGQPGGMHCSLIRSCLIIGSAVPQVPRDQGKAVTELENQNATAAQPF